MNQTRNKTILVGLGNKGKSYEGNRHNLGFMLIDQLAKRWQVQVEEKRFHSLCGSTEFQGQTLILLKPQTYMNRSGLAVQDILRFFRLSPRDLVVLCDDIYLELGRIRIRKKGSDGGHNGLKSIISDLNSSDFIRMRLGVGEASLPQNFERFLLSNFRSTEKERLKNLLISSQKAVEVLLTESVDQAMNRFN